jgi:hypothetical protein
LYQNKSAAQINPISAEQTYQSVNTQVSDQELRWRHGLRSWIRWIRWEIGCANGENVSVLRHLYFFFYRGMLAWKSLNFFWNVVRAANWQPLTYNGIMLFWWALLRIHIFDWTLMCTKNLSQDIKEMTLPMLRLLSLSRYIESSLDLYRETLEKNNDSEREDLCPFKCLFWILMHSFIWSTMEMQLLSGCRWQVGA